jgi:hypothetical protein
MKERKVSFCKVQINYTDEQQKQLASVEYAFLSQAIRENGFCRRGICNCCMCPAIT